MIFASSEVYGLDCNMLTPMKINDDPFNHYGKSKWEAEKVIKAWYDKKTDKVSNYSSSHRDFLRKELRNVYNLLKQQGLKSS